MESECELASIEEAKLADPISDADWVAMVLVRHKIFLSHSGVQKNFVEQLCEDLERAKQSPFFDKRTHSLPKGEEFAPLIFTAAKECVLAVVVVSDDYFTRSKWPMLELAAIVQAPGCKILPLFFGLSCKEFKNPKRRERWFQVWDGWSKSDNRICVDVWKAALRNLDGMNSMEYVKANGEVFYREEIVTTVCDLMQRRSQDEIIVVENTSTSNACELDPTINLPWPNDQTSTATGVRRSMYNCLRTTLVVMFQLVVVVLTLLLLFYGYDHYSHKCQASPSDGPLKLDMLSTEDFLAQKERSAESLTKAFDAFYILQRRQLSEFDNRTFLAALGYLEGNPDSCNSDYVRADELLNIFLNARSKVVDPEKITNEQYLAAAFRSLRPQIFNNFPTVDERRTYFDTSLNSVSACHPELLGYELLGYHPWNELC